MKLRRLTFGSVVLVALVFSSLATSGLVVAAPGINQQIPFTGTLKNSSGTALSGTYDMVFRIYDAASGGNTLWTGTHTAGNGNVVSVSDGVFSVLLGSGGGNALSLDFNDDAYWLGITIEADTEMSPRTRLGAAGYAFNADTVDGFHAGDFIQASTSGRIEAATAASLFTITQNGAGNLIDLYDGGSLVFSVADGGLTTLSALYNQNEYYDASNSEGTPGYILQSTGTSTMWVATSTLGLGGGSGTVTSVGLSGPTGFTISNSPVINSGTLSFSYSAGYGPVLTASTTEWTTAFGWGDHGTSGYIDSVSAAGLEETGSAVALTAGYIIPLSASTTQWASAFTWGDHSLSGYLTATATPEEIEDVVGSMLNGTESGISVSYQDGTNSIDFVVDNITAAMLNAEDFGSFTCNGTVCTFDTSTVSSSTLQVGGTYTNGYILAASSTAAGGFAWYATSSPYLNLASGGSSVTFGTDNQIPIMNAGGTDFEYSSNFTFNGTDLNLGASNGLAIGGTRMFYASSTNSLIAIGNSAGSSSTGNFNSFIGTNAGASNSGSFNDFIGFSAGRYNSGLNNDFIGFGTGHNNSGSYTTFIGIEAGARMSASSSVAIGGYALRGGSGFFTLGNAATTTNNTVIGYGAGYNVATGGDNNILLGYQAANSLTTGANNIVIGYDVEAPSNTGSNQLNIGNLLFGTGIDGTGTTLSSGNVGIGTSSPASKLDVWGDFRVGTSSLPSLFVDASGNFVSLGTTTSTNSDSDYMLHIAQTADQKGLGITGYDDRASSRMKLYIGGTGTSVIDASSVLEIGRFDDTQLIRIANGGVTINYSNSTRGFNVQGVTDNSLIQTDSALDRVGIGTSSPASKLDVWGDLRVGTSSAPTLFTDTSLNQTFIGTASVGAGSDTLSILQNADSSGLKVYGFDDQSGSYGSMYVDSSGTAYIGGGGIVYLASGAGSRHIRLSSSGVALNIDNNAGQDFRVEGDIIDDLFFVDAGTERIGIATDTPTHTLSIAGDLYATGALYDNTNSAGSVGMVLQSTGTGFNWVATSTLGLGGGGSSLTVGTDNQIPYNNAAGDDFDYSANFTFDGTDFAVNTDDLFVDGGSGFVGIGTTSPASKLTIAQSADSNGFRIAGFDDESNEGGHMFVDSTGIFNIDANGPTGSGYISSGGTVIAAWNVGQFVLPDARELSFGTDFDYSWGYNAADDTLRLVNGNDSSSDASTRLTINSSGDIGIGTTSPASKLDVWGDFRVGTNSTPTLFTDVSSNRVGIGTSSPYAKLAIVGTQGLDFVIEDDEGDQIFLFDTAGVNNDRTNIYFTYDAIEFDRDNVNAGLKVGVRSSGSLNAYFDNENDAKQLELQWAGIIKHLFFNEGLSIGTTTMNAALAVQSVGTTDILNLFETGGVEVFTVQENGDVGIGTTTLSQKLTVAGNIRVGASTGLGCVEDYDGTLIGGTCSSDERLKTNIEPLIRGGGTNILDGLVALTPVTYNWNKDAADEFSKSLTVTNTGLIAQDVEEQFPELVVEHNGIKQVKFSALPFYIMEAIKEMWQVVTGNTEKIESLEERVEALEAELGNESQNNNNSVQEEEETPEQPDENETAETPDEEDPEAGIDEGESAGDEEDAPVDTIEDSEENILDDDGGAVIDNETFTEEEGSVEESEEDPEEVTETEPANEVTEQKEEEVTS